MGGGERACWMRMLLHLGRLPMSRADEALGKMHFWWMFSTYNFAFILTFWAGLYG